MNQKGEIILATALIIAGAVLIGSLFIAYRPKLACSIYTADAQQPPECVAAK